MVNLPRTLLLLLLEVVAVSVMEAPELVEATGVPVAPVADSIVLLLAILPLLSRTVALPVLDEGLVCVLDPRGVAELPAELREGDEVGGAVLAERVASGWGVKSEGL